MPSKLVVAHSGAVVAERLREATCVRSRMRGLVGHSDLGAREGLLLRPCKQVHTFCMTYAIDVVFLDRNWRVSDIVVAMPPRRVSRLYWKAHHAIELAEGAAASVSIGDRLLRLEAPL